MYIAADVFYCAGVSSLTNQSLSCISFHTLSIALRIRPAASGLSMIPAYPCRVCALE